MNDRVVVLTFIGLIMLVVGGVIATVVQDETPAEVAGPDALAPLSSSVEPSDRSAVGVDPADLDRTGLDPDAEPPVPDDDTIASARPTSSVAGEPPRLGTGTFDGPARRSADSPPRRRRVTPVPPAIATRRFRIATEDELEKALTQGEWEIVDGLVSAEASAGSIDASLTLPTYYAEIERVVIRGGLDAESPHNFRIQAGPVSVILNWEVRDENHYRIGTRRTVDPPSALEPGREHEIILVQREEFIHLLVDDEERWKAKGTLHGPVTVYPALGSKIFVRDIAIRGRAVADVKVTGPAYPLQ